MAESIETTITDRQEGKRAIAFNGKFYANIRLTKLINGFRVLLGEKLFVFLQKKVWTFI